jgi:hypothetical protein
MMLRLKQFPVDARDACLFAEPGSSACQRGRLVPSGLRLVAPRSMRGTTPGTGLLSSGPGRRVFSVGERNGRLAASTRNSAGVNPAPHLAGSPWNPTGSHSVCPWEPGYFDSSLG